MPRHEIPAYPTHHPETYDHSAYLVEGMSLRDWFAGQALIGLLSSRYHIRSSGLLTPEQFHAEAETVARMAGILADKMMEER